MSEINFTGLTGHKGESPDRPMIWEARPGGAYIDFPNNMRLSVFFDRRDPECPNKPGCYRAVFNSIRLLEKFDTMQEAQAAGLELVMRVLRDLQTAVAQLEPIPQGADLSIPINWEDRRAPAVNQTEAEPDEEPAA